MKHDFVHFVSERENWEVVNHPLTAGSENEALFMPEPQGSRHQGEYILVVVVVLFSTIC